MEDPVDLLHLTGTQLLIRIEAPPASQQPLPSQHLVDPWNAAVEIVGGIENRGVRISGFHTEPKKRREGGSAEPVPSRKRGIRLSASLPMELNR